MLDQHIPIVGVVRGQKDTSPGEGNVRDSPHIADSFCLRPTRRATGAGSATRYVAIYGRIRRTCIEMQFENQVRSTPRYSPGVPEKHPIAVRNRRCGKKLTLPASPLTDR